MRRTGIKAVDVVWRWSFGTTEFRSILWMIRSHWKDLKLTMIFQFSNVSIRKKVSGLYCVIKCRKQEDMTRMEWWGWSQLVSHRSRGKIQQDFLSRLSTFRVLRYEWGKQRVIWVIHIEMLLKWWRCRSDQCQPVAGSRVMQSETLRECIPW